MILELNKKYIYNGDTESYVGRICIIMDLWEYKNRECEHSYVHVRFEGENFNWAVRAGSLLEIKQEK